MVEYQKLVPGDGPVSPAQGQTGKAPADSQPRSGGLPLARYLQYVNWFNEGDPRYLEFYHPDVVLELGNATINGAFPAMDGNGDGFVTQAEYSAYAKAHMK